MTLLEAAKELLAMIDDVGPPEHPQTDRVFAQFEFDNLRAAVSTVDVQSAPSTTTNWPDECRMHGYTDEGKGGIDLSEGELAMLQRFASYCRSCALSGESNPMEFETFINMPANKETR